MLVEKGYEVEIRGGQFILVHHIPYVNSKKEICYGTLVDALVRATTEKLGKPDQHFLEFTGEGPCDADGTPLTGRVHARHLRDLGNNIVVFHRLSAKPRAEQYPDRLYPDYYEKIRTYAEMLLVHARAIDPNVTATPGRHHAEDQYASVFRYPNTNAAKSKISGNSKVFENQDVAIVGLGGTGSYLLDLLAKTEVRSIHLYDDDQFQLHNAFRAPGAAKAADFKPDEAVRKVDYLFAIYTEMHKYVHPHTYRIDQQTIAELEQFQFVFLCVDDAEARYFIASYLKDKKIPFIDAALGVDLTPDNLLVSKIRVTTATEHRNDHLANRISGQKANDDVYNDNIQIAELNALAATLAVIRWKKHIGYYQDLKSEHNSYYFSNTGKLQNEFSNPETTE
jgi:hypothetical protein